MKRSLVVDAQLFQTPAWHRGMGKYSYELLKSLTLLNKKTSTWHDIIVLLSSKLPLDPSVPKALDCLDGIRVATLDLEPNDILDPHTTVQTNKKVINDYMQAEFSQPDAKEGAIDFFILSLMQGEISPVFPAGDNVQKIVLFYDLIPLMLYKIYLQNPITQKEYLSKISELIAADTYLAISKTVANDLAVYLGIEPKRIISIDGGPIEHSRKSKRLEVPHPFILMPTGNDLRKNNRRAITGFEEFNTKQGGSYTLVITSFFKEEEIQELKKLSPNVVFTGNISGDELNYLYEETTALLFPSEYEGLGLPILEAAEKNKPIACSNISVFREMSKSAFNYFDPEYASSIAAALERTVNSKPDTAAYKKILKKYNWEATAEAAEQIISSQKAGKTLIRKKLLHVYSIDSALPAYEAKLLQQSHGELSVLFDISYTFAAGAVPMNESSRINYLPFVTRAAYVSQGEPIRLYDDVINFYHISNRKQAAQIVFTALAKSGIVLLHDLNIDTAWQAMASDLSLIDASRYEAEQGLDQVYGHKDTGMLVSLVTRQKAVLVFSAEAKAVIEVLLAKAGKSVPVYVLDVPSNDIVYPETLPDKLGAGSVESGAALPEGINSISGETDFAYETALSKLRALYLEDARYTTASLLPAAEAAKYGTIPVALKNGKAGDDSLIHTVTSKQLKEIATNAEAFVRTVDYHHNYAGFAAQIATIVDKLKQDDEVDR